VPSRRFDFIVNKLIIPVSRELTILTNVTGYGRWQVWNRKRVCRALAYRA
jgi:hypothetical protein